MGEQECARRECSQACLQVKWLALFWDMNGCGSQGKCLQGCDQAQKQSWAPLKKPLKHGEQIWHWHWEVRELPEPIKTEWHMMFLLPIMCKCRTWLGYQGLVAYGDVEVKVCGGYHRDIDGLPTTVLYSSPQLRPRAPGEMAFQLFWSTLTMELNGLGQHLMWNAEE